MDIGFVQIGFLLAFAALAIPLVLHFTHRSRPRIVDLGSIRFLREILQRTRNRRRVMRWLLLALRVGLVGLLALAFARPYLSQRITGGEKQCVMLLVDGSASMRATHDGESSFDRARRIAQTLLEETPAGAKVEVAVFADGVRPIRREDLDAQEASFAVTDYSAALRWAADATRLSSATAKRVHLITDLQQSGLQWSEAATMPADVSLEIHDVAETEMNNLAVTAAAPQRLVVHPGQSGVINATISNFGPFALEDAVATLTLRQQNMPIRVEQRVTVASGATEQVTFQCPPLAVGLWQGAVSLEAIDDLMVDNLRHVAILVAPPLRVLLVDGDMRDTPYQSETYFLDLALRLGLSDEEVDASPYAPETVATGAPLPALKGYAAVVLANASGLSAEDANRLAEFVRTGGGLMFFGGENVSPEGCRTLIQAGLIPGAVSSNRVANDLPFRIELWETTHLILTPFADPQHGDLRRITFRGYTPLVPSSDARVLAQFGDGSPALVERPLSRGRILWFASSCDLSWSDWPRGALFVPMVRQMVGQLAGLNDGGPVRSVLVGDKGEANAAPGVSQQGDHWQVVNLDPRESETQRCDAEEIRTRFGAHGAETGSETSVAADGATGQATAGAWEFRQNEFWKWLVVALVGLAALEFVVGNRVAA
jgi:hypothetical protein